MCLAFYVRTDALKSREEASERDLDTRQTREQTGELSIETTVFVTMGKSDVTLHFYSLRYLAVCST